ncbi:trehalose-phosphatase [Bdellovibrionota bacterium FG-2]
MKYLFSDVGLQVLESLSFTQTLYAFDFDGTLAPIVTKPESAKPSLTTARLLGELNQCASVAVISGRSVADLRSRVEFRGAHLIGNHGLEGLGVRKAAIKKAAAVCGAWAQQLANGWEALKTHNGVFVENKTYSLALHYRRSRNKQQARAELFALIAGLQPAPRVILGKCVMNLVPAGGPHKGVALLEAMMKLNLKCAFYIGDDDTDEDVFSLSDNRLITVRVGQSRTSQAQFFIRRQSEIVRLIRLCVRLNASG